MKNKRSKIFIVLAIFALLASLGFGCRCQTGAVKEGMKPVTLNYWTIFNDSTDYNQLIAGYKALHPNVNIVVTKLAYEEFDHLFKERLALDQGPDIVSVNNLWLKKYQPFLSPMPPAITLPYMAMEGPSCKKESVVRSRTIRTYTKDDIKKNFVNAVYEDVIIDDQVYGLPLSLDTLVLYYNQKLLDEAGIVEPAQTWEKLQEHASKISRAVTNEADGTADLLISGVALGTADNISRPQDILSVLMMQLGATMTDGESAAFNNVYRSGEELFKPAENAVEYYLQFASPYSKVYSWNDAMPSAFDAFTEKQNLAYFFGYHYHLSQIRNKAPKLDLGIAPIPQVSLEGPTNYANYWVEAVANKSPNKDFAWDFLIYATNKDNAAVYLEKTKKPTALRNEEIIEKQKENSDLQPFVSQILTAQSWYKGASPQDYDSVFKGIIRQSFAGGIISQVLNSAVNAINFTHRAR